MTARRRPGRRGRRLPPLAWAAAAFVLLGITAALTVYGALFRPGPELHVRTAAGAEVLRVPLRTDPTWEIRRVDAATGVAVRDIYAWIAGRMLLTDTLTPRLDVAGLGDAVARGEIRDDGEGGHWIAHIDAPVPDDVHWLRVGSERMATVLVHGAREYDLSETHPGERLRLEVVTP